MGSKRAFGNEDISQDLPLKHARQFEYCNKLDIFAEMAPCYRTPQKFEFPGENDSGPPEHQWHEDLEKVTVTEVSDWDKEFETSNPFSWVTSNSSEEDAGSVATTLSPLSPEDCEYMPRRTSIPCEDVNFSFSDGSPGRQAPIGPNHQASLPIWCGHIKRNMSDKIDPLMLSGSSNNLGSDNNIVDNGKDEKFMGTCVISIPDSSLDEDGDEGTGNYQKDCGCIDRGSVRCVRQHIAQAKDSLRRTLGDNKFLNLGFFDMGEDVAYRWSEEEEQIFYETLYSNPISMGRNFWNHLSAALPSRSRRELVSFYFNVFMLRRRAVQNRSKSLDIDSDDDDEWQGRNMDSYEFKVQVKEEDEDSAIESLVVQDDRADHEVYSRKENGGGNVSDVEDCDSDVDVGYRSRDATKEDSGLDNISKTNILPSFTEEKFDPIVQHPVKNNKTDRGRCLRTKSDAFSDGMDHVYDILDPSDTKVWDAHFDTCPNEDFDLLPTWKMIEEIFGQD